MNKPVYTLGIRTLGRFSISVDGKTVATDWPDEKIKVFFCSLLSPLDLYFTWDRICRSLLGVPETRSSRRQLEERFIRPLNHFLLKELGFNPLIAGAEGIRIDPQGIHLDVFEFYRAVVDGLNLVSLDDLGGARKKFSRANLLYVGSYLPGMPGKIIEHTRMELESLYQTAVKDGVWQTRTALCPGTDNKPYSRTAGDIAGDGNGVRAAGYGAPGCGGMMPVTQDVYRMKILGKKKFNKQQNH